MTYWPGWLGGVALATVMLLHWFGVGRMMAVSGRVSAIVDRLRFGREEQSEDDGEEMTQEEMLAAIRAETTARFGSDALTEPTSAEPVEEFAPLRWELSIGPGEYILIGSEASRAGTLGHAYFLPAAEQATQYLLVLRALRVPAGPGANEATGVAPPLAAQAAGLMARGSGR